MEKDHTGMIKRYNRLIEDSIKFLIYAHKTIIPQIKNEIDVGNI